MAAPPTLSVLGKPIPRIEGFAKLSGGAPYAADVHLPGMLWARLVRSPHPHARVVRIDTSRALRVPGVRAILTAADIPHRLVGQQTRDQPVLCWDRVLYAGDRVAAVAADDADAAEEAMLAVVVEYEELPAVFDPLEAMQLSAPVLHPEAFGYVGFPKGIPPGRVLGAHHP
jgi:xanthine dehydrogenase molybdenum-binding subunit